MNGMMEVYDVTECLVISLGSTGFKELPSSFLYFLLDLNILEVVESEFSNFGCSWGFSDGSMESYQLPSSFSFFLLDIEHCRGVGR